MPAKGQVVIVITGQKTSQKHRFKNQPGRGEDAIWVFGWSDMPQDA
jgi:hypothetical protein